MRTGLAGLCAILLTASPAAAQSCATVRFPDGYTSGVIEGVAPADGVVCYALDMAPHDANLDIGIEGQNVMFGYDDGFEGADAQTRVRMVPQGHVVRVMVGQLMRAAGAQPFRLTISFLPPGNG